MKNSRDELELKRVDAALHDTLSGVEQPSLSATFEATLERRLRWEVKASSGRAARRTMRVYWLLAGIATLLILLSVGSPSPMITWSIVVSLAVALLLGAAPQFLFWRAQRVSLLDLILSSVR